MTYKMASNEDFAVITKGGGKIIVPNVEASPQFSNTSAYAFGSRVYVGCDRYKCISPVSAPATGNTNPSPKTDSAHWVKLEPENMAKKSEILYDVAQAQTSTSGTTMTVTLADRTSNIVSVPSYITEIALVFPPPEENKCRDFIMVLTCGDTPLSLSYSSDVILFASDDIDLAPQNGRNVYSFTEMENCQFCTGHIKLELQGDSVPKSIENLMALMTAMGYDTSSITTLDGVRAALGLPANTTIDQCITALIYG
jgi:hypothetical protein